MAITDDPFKGMRNSMNDQGLGTFAGLTSLLKGAGTPVADAGTAKIPLSLLPAGVGPGQRISLTVTGIDAVSGMATVVPDAVQNAVPSAPPAAAPTVQPDAVDKSITMGPMDAFRSFLFKQTQDLPENQP